MTPRRCRSMKRGDCWRRRVGIGSFEKRFTGRLSREIRNRYWRQILDWRPKWVQTERRWCSNSGARASGRHYGAGAVES